MDGTKKRKTAGKEENGGKKGRCFRRLKVALLHNRPVTRGITVVVGACNVEYCERGINPRRGGLAGWFGECREWRDRKEERRSETERVAGMRA